MKIQESFLPSFPFFLLLHWIIYTYYYHAHAMTIPYIDIVGNILVALTNQNRSRQGVARQIVKMGLVASREDLKKKKVFKRVSSLRTTFSLLDVADSVY